MVRIVAITVAGKAALQQIVPVREFVDVDVPAAQVPSDLARFARARATNWVTSGAPCVRARTAARARRRLFFRLALVTRVVRPPRARRLDSARPKPWLKGSVSAGVRVRSAGTSRHEMVPDAAIDAVFAYFARCEVAPPVVPDAPPLPPAPVGAAAVDTAGEG